jgi:TldD protein
MKRRTFLQTAGAVSAGAILAKATPTTKHSRLASIPENPQKLLDSLIDSALTHGADYADARYVLLNSQTLQSRKDIFFTATDNETAGIALRVYKNGNWGMSATSQFDKFDNTALAKKACSLAEANGLVKQIPLNMEGRLTTSLDPWKSSYKTDPFTVELNEKVDFLVGLSAPPMQKEGIVYSVANLFTSKKRVLYRNSLGGSADQTYIVTYPNFGLTAYYQSKGRVDSRNSDIEPVQAGWEITSDYDFKNDLERTINQVLEKNNLAKNVVPESYDIVVTSSHLWKLLYDTLAPHLDPYTVTGLDGDSPQNAMFKRDDFGTKNFSNSLLNLDFDNRMPRGLATTAVDDAGMTDNNGTIIRNGVLTALPGSDELRGSELNLQGNSTRAESWDQQPKFAMPNLFMHPANEDISAQDLVKDVKKGILVSGRSQTILTSDRKSFRTSGQLGWLIENGKVKNMIREFVYEGNTEYFWNMLDAIGGKETVTIGGDMFPQNNSPIWQSPFSIAVPSARFTNINVFSTAGGAK